MSMTQDEIDTLYQLMEFEAARTAYILASIPA